MSACDRCFAPGACCRGFTMSNEDGQPSTFWTDKGEKGIQKQLRERKLPFVVETVGSEHVDEETGRPYAQIWVRCPKLDPVSGRCTIYPRRPKICRDFEPGQNQLCVHWRGAEAGDPTVPLDMEM